MFSPAGLQRPQLNQNPYYNQAPQGMSPYQMPPNFLSQTNPPEQQEKKPGIFGRIFGTISNIFTNIPKIANTAKNLAIAGLIGGVLIAGIMLWRNFPKAKGWIMDLVNKGINKLTGGFMDKAKELFSTLGGGVTEAGKGGGWGGAILSFVTSKLTGQQGNTPTVPVVKK